MGGDAATRLVDYPIDGEAEATGVVAGLLSSMPFISILFQATATRPVA